jgi:hypothetical protein
MQLDAGIDGFQVRRRGRGQRNKPTRHRAAGGRPPGRGN